MRVILRDYQSEHIHLTNLYEVDLTTGIRNQIYADSPDHNHFRVIKTCNMSMFIISDNAGHGHAF